MAKYIYILTGGTLVHVTPHFALCAPAYGNVGMEIYTRLVTGVQSGEFGHQYTIVLVRTKMAETNSSETMSHLERFGISSAPETNEEAKALAQAIAADPNSVALIMAATICDFEPIHLQAVGRTDTTEMTHFGKGQPRLPHVETLTLQMQPSDKIIDGIKAQRPDMLLVTFKTTAGVTSEELFAQAFYNLQKSHSDFVFANDIHTYQNMVVTANSERLHSKDRGDALDLLCAHLLSAVVQSPTT